MSQLFGQNQGWSIGRGSGTCAACGSGMPPGQVCWAALVEAPATAAPPSDHPPTAPAAPNAAPEGGKDATGSSFGRVDFCEGCWGAGQRPAGGEMFSFWRTVVPAPNAKRKLFVDDSVLLDIFNRLEGKESGQDVRFRFVLALVLMRKRLLKYEGSELVKQAGALPPEGGGIAPAAAAGVEVWTMVPRGENAVATRVVNPNLTPEEIGEVSGQLSQILAEEV